MRMAWQSCTVSMCLPPQDYVSVSEFGFGLAARIAAYSSGEIIIPFSRDLVNREIAYLTKEVRKNENTVIAKVAEGLLWQSVLP